MTLVLVLITAALLFVAFAIWRLGNMYRAAMNEHIHAMEAVEQRLAGIENALQVKREE
ncbi:MAG: hypothetical protein R2867_47655 [Caldilineaceae bacterium]